MDSQPESRIPQDLIAKAAISGKEYGWRQADFLEVIEAARQVQLAIIGGQIQYVLPDGTCDLYWLNFDPAARQQGEGWQAYCNRTAEECSKLFTTIISTVDIEQEAIDSFSFLREKKAGGLNLERYNLFILYFDDSQPD